jgi:hypothetical protein
MLRKLRSQPYEDGGNNGVPRPQVLALASLDEAIELQSFLLYVPAL